MEYLPNFLPHIFISLFLIAFFPGSTYIPRMTRIEQMRAIHQQRALEAARSGRPLHGMEGSTAFKALVEAKKLEIGAKGKN